MLKGTLLLQDLNLKIAAGDFFDLDAVGRDKAEGSISLRTAFEEGYLQNIEKEGHADGDQIVPGYGQLVLQQKPVSGLTNTDVAAQLTELREMLAQQQAAAAAAAQQPAAGGYQMPPNTVKVGSGEVFSPAAFAEGMKEAIASMAREVSSSIKDEMEKLSKQQRLIAAEKQEVLSAENMSDAEVRARLALLDSKEKELKSNFQELGKQLGRQNEGTGQAADLADLLDGL